MCLDADTSPSKQRSAALSLGTVQPLAAGISYIFFLKCEWPRIVWARHLVTLSVCQEGPGSLLEYGGYKRLVTRGRPTNNHKHPSYFSPTPTHPFLPLSLFFLFLFFFPLLPLLLSFFFFSPPFSSQALF